MITCKIIDQQGKEIYSGKQDMKLGIKQLEKIAAEQLKVKPEAVYFKGKENEKGSFEDNGYKKSQTYVFYVMRK